MFTAHTFVRGICHYGHIRMKRSGGFFAPALSAQSGQHGAIEPLAVSGSLFPGVDNETAEEAASDLKAASLEA